VLTTWGGKGASSVLVWIPWRELLREERVVHLEEIEIHAPLAKVAHSVPANLQRPPFTQLQPLDRRLDRLAFRSGQAGGRPHVERVDIELKPPVLD
jgi:hypothetical protein